MKQVNGDLIEMAVAGEFDVIVHGCNCQCTMGAGIAKAIRATFPEAYAADCMTEKGSREKLGAISHATMERDGHSVTIVNGYTQFHYHSPGVLADYEAIRSVFRTVKKEFAGTRIGYPRIGAGLAKGNWDRISDIIDQELQGEDHTLVLYAP